MKLASILLMTLIATLSAYGRTMPTQAYCACAVQVTVLAGGAITYHCSAPNTCPGNSCTEFEDHQGWRYCVCAQGANPDCVCYGIIKNFEGTRYADCNEVACPIEFGLPSECTPDDGIVVGTRDYCQCK